ncbi:ATP-binding protein [Rhizobium calliandrae]|uniref:ATP-binding protein n=1 Tax=Rhizobium calliandrae TaxID=1312182 RepID=A0ABT7KN49_9HYPH|nr:ATP-binding protein [Rhizobium calliandrae]MDL2409430.1 ATP-binding protein [Rhizobium calliandrae]
MAQFAIKIANPAKPVLRMGRLATIKTLSGFDFTVQPSVGRDRIFILAQLGFVYRHESVQFLGPPDPTTQCTPRYVIEKAGSDGLLILISDLVLPCLNGAGHRVARYLRGGAAGRMIQGVPLSRT